MKPAVPKSITGRWRTLWRDSLELLEDPSSVEARLLERCILNLIQADKALAEAAEQPMVSGSQGQPTAHPGFAVAARCDAQALSYARQLNLTPKARNADSDEAETEEGKDPITAARDELAARRAARTA